MAASAAQIARLRRMTAEPLSGSYTDAVLSDILDSTALSVTDDFGQEALVYDLAAAASEVWGEKAATTASGYAFSADGANYSRQQYHEHCTAMARHYASRRALRAITLESETDEAVLTGGTLPTP